MEKPIATMSRAATVMCLSSLGLKETCVSYASVADRDYNCTGKNCTIEASSLVLAFVNEQNQFLGMHGSLANGEHYKTVHRNMDNETEDSFLIAYLAFHLIKAPFKLTYT